MGQSMAIYLCELLFSFNRLGSSTHWVINLDYPKLAKGFILAPSKDLAVSLKHSQSECSRNPNQTKTGLRTDLASMFPWYFPC